MEKKVISITERRQAIARTRAQRRGELNDDQEEAISRLMRKLLRSGEATSIGEACDMAMERLGFK